jgi:hypothetical protein
MEMESESETIWKKKCDLTTNLNKKKNKMIRNITNPIDFIESENKYLNDDKKQNMEILEIEQKIQKINNNNKNFHPSPILDSINNYFYVSNIKEGLESQNNDNNNLYDASKNSISFKVNGYDVNLNSNTGISSNFDLNKAIPAYTIIDVIDGITGIDFADDELNRDLSNNEAGFSGSNFSACLAGKTTNVDISKKEGFGQSSEAAKKEMEQATIAANKAYTGIKDSIVYRLLIKYLKMIEFPVIYFRFFIKKLGIIYCNVLGYVFETKVSDDEKKLVISKMSSILSVLISVLITYNWFFLMFYESDGIKIKTFEISKERLKRVSSTLNFIFEFVIYPVVLLDEFMLKSIPWFLKYFFRSYDLIFFVMYITIYKITRSFGACIFDLFYDSLKLLRKNGSLRPWDETLQHTYDNNEKFSITLSTYWFFHLLIFGAQIPSIIPSFFTKETQPEISEEEKKKGIIE